MSFLAALTLYLILVFIFKEVKLLKGVKKRNKEVRFRQANS